MTSPVFRRYEPGSSRIGFTTKVPTSTGLFSELSHLTLLTDNARIKIKLIGPPADFNFAKR